MAAIPAAMPLAPGARLGPYEVLSLIGSGGMGQVYRARDTRLDRLVAVKVLPPGVTGTPEGRLRLAREARAAAALSHPNICTVHDFNSENGLDYLVMEYVDGETLADRLIAGPLSVAQALRYAIDIARALEHAHRCGFVHRDLKPANVMITKSGAVLLDFGLATAPAAGAAAAAAQTETQDLTAGGPLTGTLPYMAPEQLEGQEADTRSDIFAFGVLLYETITGRQPFARQSHAASIAAILSSDPGPMAESKPLVPPELERIARKCLAKDPEERWQHAHDLKTTLEWIAAPDGQSNRAPTAQASWREAIAWTAAGLFLVLGIVATAMSRGSAAGGSSEPVTFTVSAPDNTVLFAGGGVMAVAPDGGDLAFIATPIGGQSLIWIRSLASATPRPLINTMGATQPFWSPDSRFVGFLADGKLKKVDVASGAVQTLCEARGTAGTWSATGVILFRSEDSGAIEKVSEHGGPSTPVLGPDTARGERYLFWPQFLPDGRHFLYMSLGAERERTGIYAASLDEPQRRRLLGDESQAFYVRPGFLLFRRDATVYAQRFDPASLSLSGDAVRLVENVGFNVSTRRGAFAASDTGVLAYRTAEDSELGWFDRRGNALGTIDATGKYSDPAISPDGRTIAVARLDRQLGTEDIWLIDAARGNATQFTFDPARDRAPVWSPDGGRLAFASRREVMEQIYVKASTGVSPEELLFNPGRGVHPVAWSADGSQIIFVKAAEHTRLDLWRLLLPERKAFSIRETPASDDFAQLSPDGRWLAYDSDESGVSEVWVQPFPGPPEQKWRVSDRGGIEPKWRRDGTELFYLGADQRLMAVTVQSGPTFMHEPPRPLFRTAAAGMHFGTIGRNQYDVTADGDRFLINTPGRRSSAPITVVVNWPAMLAR